MTTALDGREKRAEAFRRKTAHLRELDVHVVGIAGAEGSAVLEFLVEKVGCKKVTGHDQHDRKEFVKWFRKAHSAMADEESRDVAERLTSYDTVAYRFGEEYLTGVDRADIVFVPQSWYLYRDTNGPLFDLSTEKLSGMMRLYFDLWPGKIIGVTGSNGKTTTTNMIYRILDRARLECVENIGHVYFAGNDRRSDQVLEVLDSVGPEGWLVLEISNRHLKMDLGRSPDISVVTNISPNHLTEYESFDQYKACKESLLKYQTRDLVAVLNVDDAESRHLIDREEKEWVGFSVREQLSRGAFLRNGQLVLKHGDVLDIICYVQELQVRGVHNVSNALAAALAGHFAGVPSKVIGEALTSFEPVPQRLELVRTVEGVEFYNDSASTTPESTMAALESFDTGTVVMILGGSSKGSDYAELVDRLLARAKGVILLESPLSRELKILLDRRQALTGPDSGGPNIHSSPQILTVTAVKDAVYKSLDMCNNAGKVVLSPAGDFGGCKDSVADYLKFRHWVGKLSDASV